MIMFAECAVCYILYHHAATNSCWKAVEKLMHYCSRLSPKLWKLCIKFDTSSPYIQFSLMPICLLFQACLFSFNPTAKSEVTFSITLACLQFSITLACLPFKIRSNITVKCGIFAKLLRLQSKGLGCTQLTTLCILCSAGFAVLG